MHTGNWVDPVSVELLAGGLFGGFIRALFGHGPTWERILVLHIVSGAVTAVLLPNVYKYLNHAELIGSPIFWICAGIFIGLFGNYIIVAVLWRFGVFKTDPRAHRPDRYEG